MVPLVFHRHPVQVHFVPMVHYLHGHFRQVPPRGRWQPGGGSNHVVVVDETAMRAKRVVHKRGSPGRKGESNARGSRIIKRLPGRTLWKKLASPMPVMKRPSSGAAVFKRPVSAITAVVSKRPSSKEMRRVWAAKNPPASPAWLSARQLCRAMAPCARRARTQCYSLQ